jgi:hypothetical protein
MSEMEMQTTSTETSTNVDPETVESSDRRTFIKNTVLAAGTVAAGSLAAASVSTVSAQDEPLQAGTAALARNPVAVLHLNFDRRKPPSVQDIQAILPSIFRLTGCITCGLIGLDLNIGINEVLPALREDLNLALEGTIPGR